jgi:hypothetical protein
MILTPCACGCGQLVTHEILCTSRLKYQGPKRYIKGHQNKGLKHSVEHIAKSTHKLSDNGRWNGGKRIDKNGYTLIKSPDHPFCNNSGYVREHRLVMEKVLERYLLKTEIVHHMNHNPSDNRPENLMLLPSAADHIRECRTGRKFPRKNGIWFTCIKCGIKFYRSACWKDSPVKYCSWNCRYPKT